MRNKETADFSGQKGAVHAFWSSASCAEAGLEAGGYAAVRAERYALQPHLRGYAGFDAVSGQHVLDIGLGVGSDFASWFESRPASLTGVDLTERSIAHARAHLSEAGINPDNAGFPCQLMVADAEALPFDADTFDLVYSWGVLHHSPDTPKAIAEVLRVLKPGGRAVIMIYHSPSIVGLALWVRYALMRGRPFTSLASIYADYLESPGTKAYTQAQARALFSGFSSCATNVHLASGDLMEGLAGQRHRGFALSMARALWPRWFIRRFLGRLGNQLVVLAVK